MKHAKLTAGLLIGAILIGIVPTTVFADTAADEKYIKTNTYSFAAGAHSAINETIVLEDTKSDDYYAGVTENDTPVVTDPEPEEVEKPEVQEEETKPVEPEKVNPYANIAIAQVNAYLNIREKADSDAKVLGKLYPNGAAIVLETLDGWYKVKSGSVTGYVSEKYVIVGDEKACKEASDRIATVTAKTLRMRKEATTDSGVYTLLSKGNKLTVVSESTDGWVKVKYKSYTGYVSADYVTIKDEYTYAESKEEEAARLAAEEAEREEERRKEENKKKEEKKKQNSSKKNYKSPSGKSGQAVVNYAVQFVGNPYVWGGTSLTKGADCSGFIMKVYQAFGISLPHSSYRLRSVGTKVSASDIQPGDIVCYSGHVAIYMGDGKIVHAANKKDGIKITNNWRYKKVLAIRRVL